MTTATTAARQRLIDMLTSQDEDDVDKFTDILCELVDACVDERIEQHRQDEPHRHADGSQS